MAVNFFDPSTQPQDPQALMAKQLMQQGMQAPGGQNVNGHYVAPQPSQYAAQLASALGGAYRMNQVQDGLRAQKILDTGEAQPAMQSGISKLGGWLGGLFGGGGS